MRWDSVDPARYLTDQARLFVRNHTSTPLIDKSTWRLRIFGDGLTTPAARRGRAVAVVRRPAPAAAHHASSRSTSAPATAAASSPSQQGTPAAGTAWKLGAVGTVVWEGVRLRDVLKKVGLVARRGLDPGHRARPQLRHRRRRLRPGPPSLPGLQGARRRHPGVGRERRAAAARPRLPAAAGAARLGRHRLDQVARARSRWRDDPAHLAVEHQVVRHDRRQLPAGAAAAVRQPGALRVGAALAGDPARGEDRHADRPGLEWSGADPSGRRQPRRRYDVAPGRAARPSRHHGRGRHEHRHDHPALRGFGWSRFSVTWRKPAPGSHALLARATDAAAASSR